MCVFIKLCVCVAIPFILDLRLVDTPPAEVTQNRGKVTQDSSIFLLPVCGDCLNFIARRIQPSLSFVDREVDFCVPTFSSFSTIY